MIARMLPPVEIELERAFDYYQKHSPGLGLELLEEFRRGVDRVLEFPGAWQGMEETYRRYRLHRFPYGIVYRTSEVDPNELLIVAFMHLSQKPGYWEP